MMIGRAWAWAWEQSLPPTLKFVLITLTACADFDGMTSVGQVALAKGVGITKRQIQRLLAELEQRGLVARTRRRRDDGTWNTDVYRVLCDWVQPGDNMSPGPGDIYGSTSILDLKSSSEGSKNIPPIVPQGGRNGVVILKPPAPEPESGKEKPVTPEDLMEGWNELVAPAGLSKCSALSPTRRRKCLLRLKEHPDLMFWETVMNTIPYSPFLRGLSQPTKEHPKPFRANFDWQIDNDVNVKKIYEGRYS
jgi:hypothetical protein